jgi:hypothetical protein
MAEVKWELIFTPEGEGMQIEDSFPNAFPHSYKPPQADTKPRYWGLE